MRRFLILVLVFVAVFAVSCSKKKSHEENDYVEQVSKEIKAEEGGTVESSDGKTSVEIPAGALDKDTTISMTIRNAVDFPSGEDEKIVSMVVEFEPSGTIFKKPVFITMPSAETVKNKVITAAVFHEDEGKWSYSESGVAVKVSQSASGDPIMTTASGDPIMLNASGDPIMMSASGDPIMLSASGDPIMTSASGDPIMNAASGDPIMMTTGHFTAYTFIVIEPKEAAEPDDTEPVDDTDTTETDTDTSDTGITDNDISDINDGITEPDDDDTTEPDDSDTSDDEITDIDDDDDAAEPDDDTDTSDTGITDNDITVIDDDTTEPDDDTEPVDNDVVPEPDPVYSKVLCTGQTRCSDGESYIDCPESGKSFHGQDAQYVSRKSCVAHKFEKHENIVLDDAVYEQVSDEATGLRWLIPQGGGGTWQNAKDFCENPEGYGGYQWRLPTVKELMTILHSDTEYPSVREAFFSLTDSSNMYWSGTSTGSSAWLLDFGYGEMLTYDYTSHFACVSGDEYGEINPENYTDNGDGTVFDSGTNLVWYKTTVSGKTWAEALKYCENLEFAGHSDWRLPNRNELVSIVD